MYRMLSGNQQVALLELNEQALTDTSLLIRLGSQWRRTVLSLERRGLVRRGRSAWVITPDGREVVRETGSDD